MRKINGFMLGMGIACMVVVASLTGCEKLEEIIKEKPASVPMNLAAEKKTAAELVDWVKNWKTGKLTDLQRDQALEKLKGRMVVFKGEVREIGTTMIDEKLFVSLKVGKINMMENLNIQFNLPESAKSTVAAWKKGETHVLRGRVEKMGDLEDDAVCEKSEVVPNEVFDKDTSAVPSGK